MRNGGHKETRALAVCSAVQEDTHSSQTFHFIFPTSWEARFKNIDLYLTDLDLTPQAVIKPVGCKFFILSIASCLIYKMWLFRRLNKTIQINSIVPGQLVQICDSDENV